VYKRQAYADCNGDGIVDEADAKVIESNRSNTHNDVLFVADEILEAFPEVNPQFAFLPDTLLVAPSALGEFQISLASNDEPIEEILGVAFTLNYDPRFFQANSVNFDLFGSAWITPFERESTSLILKNPEAGKLTVSTMITDRQPVSGGGFIGTVSFVIIEDAIDLLVATDTVTIKIDSITVFKENLEKVPVAGATAVIEIEGRTTSTHHPILDNLEFYPNPNNGWILLRTNDIEVERVEVLNGLGQRCYQKKLNKNTFHSLDLQELPRGVYWLRMITEYGTRSVPIQRL